MLGKSTRKARRAAAREANKALSKAARKLYRADPKSALTSGYVLIEGFFADDKQAEYEDAGTKAYEQIKNLPSRNIAELQIKMHLQSSITKQILAKYGITLDTHVGKHEAKLLANGSWDIADNEYDEEDEDELDDDNDDNDDLD